MREYKSVSHPSKKVIHISASDKHKLSSLQYNLFLVLILNFSTSSLIYLLQSIQSQSSLNVIMHYQNVFALSSLLLSGVNCAPLPQTGNPILQWEIYH